MPNLSLTLRPGASVIITFTTVIHAQIFFTLKKAALKNYDKKFVHLGW